MDELRDEIGEEDFEEVVELFLEEVEEVIARLTTSPDPACYEDDLHFLKGSALNLGFRDFANFCAEAEQKLAQAEQRDIDLAPVIAGYTASKSQFLSHLQADRAA